MFALPLSLGLALLPFASAAVHDIQVGAEGKLQFWPEAIVSLANWPLCEAHPHAHLLGCPTR